MVDTVNTSVELAESPDTTPVLDNSLPTDSSTPSRPENVPEKFWNPESGEVNVEALLESNRHLESQFTQQQQSEEAGVPPAEGAEEFNDGENSAVQTAFSEYEESGSLSDQTFESLEAAGLPREIVESYIAGQEAIQSSFDHQVFSKAGGSAESYAEMIEWASQNLTPKEIEAYNVQVTNPSTSVHAAEQMYSRYQSEAPREPTLVSGQGNGGLGVSGYKNTAEMQADMSNPLYQTDSEFRAQVAKKMQAAERGGVRLFG